jgi:hypothetical protein
MDDGETPGALYCAPLNTPNVATGTIGKRGHFSFTELEEIDRCVSRGDTIPLRLKGIRK